MTKLAVADLWKLEEYAERRVAFRAQVIAHKKNRTVHLGEHLTLVFEDRITIQYQVQEMLRIERIFEKAGIQDELDAYNPLIPDGSNWKATCLIQYEDVEERRRALAQLNGIEHCIWVRAGNSEKVIAIADEDMERSNEEKTSAVHFLRFELPPLLADQVRAGAGVEAGVDHPAYRQVIALPEAARRALAADLDRSAMPAA